jgi:hypothetical protein
MLDFVKFSCDESRTTWEHINEYTAQLGEAGTFKGMFDPLPSVATPHMWLPQKIGWCLVCI